VCSSHVAFVSWGVHDFVRVAYGEFCGVGFKGGEAVAEVGGWAVEGRARKVTHRRDGGAEGSVDLPFEGVQLGVAEEAELEGEVLADEEAPDDAYSAGLR
jgi:hypothetical protein